jgi:hydrogenase assembly chaperone HypC/HupF
MCIGFPGRVVAIDPLGAIVETEGRRRRASTLLRPDVAIGDWVTVAAGTVVDRLEPGQAMEIQALLNAASDTEPGDPPAREGVPNVHAS